MPWNTYLGNKTRYKQDYWQAHWTCNKPKLSSMTTGNLTEHFEEFTQGGYGWLIYQLGANLCMV